jgi:WD40 repeat protein
MPCHYITYKGSCCSEPLGVLHGHTGEINDVKYDQLLNVLISVSDDATVRVWDTEDVYLRTFDTPIATSNVEGIPGLPDALQRHAHNMLISNATPESTRCCVTKLTSASQGPLKLMSMDVSPFGGIVAVGGDDGIVHLLSTARWMAHETTLFPFGAPLNVSPSRISNSSSPASEVLASSEGNRLSSAVGLRCAPVPVGEMRSGNSSISTICFSHDGKRLICGSFDDGSASLWRLTYTAAMSITTCLTPIPVATAADRSCPFATSRGRPVRVHHMAWSCQDAYFFVSVTRTFPPEETVPPFNNSSDAINAAVSSSKTGRTVGNGSSVHLPVAGSPQASNVVNLPPKIGVEERHKVEVCDPHIQVWSRDGSYIGSLRGHTRRIACVCPHPSDERVLLSISDDGRVILYEVCTGT